MKAFKNPQKVVWPPKNIKLKSFPNNFYKGYWAQIIDVQTEGVKSFHPCNTYHRRAWGKTKKKIKISPATLTSEKSVVKQNKNGQTAMMNNLD